MFKIHSTILLIAIICLSCINNCRTDKPEPQAAKIYGEVSTNYGENLQVILKNHRQTCSSACSEWYTSQMDTVTVENGQFEINALLELGYTSASDCLDPDPTSSYFKYSIELINSDSIIDESYKFNVASLSSNDDIQIDFL